MVNLRLGRASAAMVQANCECRCAERHGTDQESPTLSTDLALTLRHLGFPSGNKQPALSRADGFGIGAGFALAPRKLKRPIQRLRINASP